MNIQHQFAVRYPDLAVFPREIDERIAQQGLHLLTRKEIQVGEQVGLQFRFPQREEPLQAIGVVGWVSAQPDQQGRRSIVVRDLTFDSASQRILDLVRRTPVVEDAEVASHVPSPRSTAAAPAAPATPTPAVPRAAERPSVAVAAATVTGGGDEAARRKKIVLIVVACAVLLLGALAGWLFGLGGWRYVAMALMAPPATVMPDAPAIRGGVEPSLPAPPVAAPPPKPVPPATATSFDYFQRPGLNEFTLTFTRPPARVVTSRTTSPLMQTFYIERARENLDKSQYFLPFDMIRTVAIEEEGGNLRVSFLAQRPDWLPTPVWELRGRELVVRFIATD